MIQRERKRERVIQRERERERESDTEREEEKSCQDWTVVELFQ